METFDKFEYRKNYYKIYIERKRKKMRNDYYTGSEMESNQLQVIEKQDTNYNCNL